MPARLAKAVLPSRHLGLVAQPNTLWAFGLQVLLALVRAATWLLRWYLPLAKCRKRNPLEHNVLLRRRLAELVGDDNGESGVKRFKRQLEELPSVCAQRASDIGSLKSQNG